MKERYISLMEQALSAYPDAHIQRYFDDVKRDGLTEHGFPCLAANRNGRYRAFAAVGGERLSVHIEILPVKGAQML